jgi:hypothetical protein
VAGAFFTRLRFRVMLWWAARTMPFRVRNLPLNAVLKLARPDAAMPYRGLSLAYVLKRVRRTARRPVLMRDRRCLREGLLAFRFLNAAGFDPELHFGIDQTSLPGPRLKAHCWIVQEGEIVLNPPDENMTPIYIHRSAAGIDTSATRLGSASSFD